MLRSSQRELSATGPRQRPGVPEVPTSVSIFAFKGLDQPTADVAQDEAARGAQPLVAVLAEVIGVVLSEMKVQVRLTETALHRNGGVSECVATLLHCSQDCRAICPLLRGQSLEGPCVARACCMGNVEIRLQPRRGMLESPGVLLHCGHDDLTIRPPGSRREHECVATHSHCGHHDLAIRPQLR
eukprot:scaffold80117_cov65-Phaeocystis_antarctica.AAC.2